MIKRLTQSLVVIMFLLVIFDVTTSNGVEATEENVSAIAGAIDISWPTEDELTLVDTDTMIVGEPVEEEEPELTELDSELYLQYQKMGYTEEEFLDDLELLECITLAEAGNQSEYGKRLVIDTVLNRIDSPCWRDDDTIREAITHPSQYTTYSNQAYTYQEMNEDIARLVKEELLNRTNYEVIYFRTEYYFSWCPSVLQEGDHFFGADIPR